MKTSDATKWDIKLIPWGNPLIYSNPSIYNRDDIFSTASAYSQREFFNNLPAERYVSLNYNNIKDYNLIEDHNKISANKYLEDLGCRVCSFNRGGQNIRFSASAITNPKGGYVSIPGGYPSGTLFIARNDRIEAVMPENARTIIAKNDDVTINVKGEELVFPSLKTKIVMGGVVTLDGLYFTGKLSYKNGQPYIKYKDSIIAHNVKINAGTEGDILIFRDGLKHDIPINYVSLNPISNSIYAGSHDSHINLDFIGSTDFLKGDESSDSVGMQLFKAEMSLINRDQEGLIPLAQFKTNDEKSYFTILDGKINVAYSGNRLIAKEEIPTPSTSSYPLTVTATDNSGKNLVGNEKEPKKVIISNFNEVATVPLSAESGEISDLRWSAPGEVSERLYFNYEQFDYLALRKRYPNRVISGNNEQIKKISDALDRLPQAMVDSINSVIVIDKDTFELISPRSGGFASLAAGGISLSEDSVTEEAVHHEAAHVFTGKKIREFESQNAKYDYAWEKLKKDLQEIADKNYPQLNIRVQEISSDSLNYDFDRSQEDKIKAFDSYAKQRRRYLYDSLEKDAEKKDIFLSRWIKVAGDVYGKDLGSKDVGGNREGTGTLSSKWKDGTEVPRNGCVSAYACNNYMEDIAEYTGNAKRKPEFFSPLIDSRSPIYDERVRTKINLLYSNGFIDQESYVAITSTRGSDKGDHYEINLQDGRIYKYFYKDGKIITLEGEKR